MKHRSIIDEPRDFPPPAAIGAIFLLLVAGFILGAAVGLLAAGGAL